MTLLLFKFFLNILPQAVLSITLDSASQVPDVSHSVAFPGELFIVLAGQGTQSEDFL